MWRPSSWSDVEALVGHAEETANLDFKRELGSSGEIAKDIAAMTVNGGVLVYGIVEDKVRRVAGDVVPIRLAGVEERLRQIAASRIAPPAEIEITILRHQADPQAGVVVVAVPPSILAPHQVDSRFPCRRGTTTDYLGDPELERLYLQRHEIADAQLGAGALMRDFTPIPGGENLRDDDCGHLNVTVRPVSRGAVHAAGAWQEPHLRSAVHRAAQRQAVRFKDVGLVRVFNAIAKWSPLQAMGWAAGDLVLANPPTAPAAAFAATMTYPANLSFQARWALGVENDNRAGRVLVAREGEVVGELTAMLAVAGEYHAGIEGAALLVVWLELYGFEGAKSSFVTRDGRYPQPDLPEAPASLSAQARATALSLRDAPDTTARQLIERWLPAFYEYPDDLFKLVVPGRAAPGT